METKRFIVNKVIGVNSNKISKNKSASKFSHYIHHFYINNELLNVEYFRYNYIFKC